MRIDRVRCYHYNQVFAVPFDSLQVKRKQADSVIVRIDCENPHCGFGESAPRRYVTGEDVASVRNVIREVFAPILFSQPITCHEDAAAVLSMCAAACQRRGITAFHSALGALDVALLDVLGSSGSTPEAWPYGSPRRDHLPFSVSVPFLPLSLIRDFFPLLSSHVDFQIIKVLIDEDIDQNTERIALIRNLAGTEKELRLEINGKLSFDQIAFQLDRFQRFDIAAVEQPLPPGDVKNLQKLRRSFDVAIIADESLVGMQSARELIETKACDLFNIKISKCGGVLRAKAIADIAAQHGISCHVGTHVGETEILGAAGRRLAYAIPNFDAYGGGSAVLFSRIFVKEKPLTRAAPLNFDPGEIVLPSYTEAIVRNSHLIADIANRQDRRQTAERSRS